MNQMIVPEKTIQMIEILNFYLSIVVLYYKNLTWLKK